MLKMRQGKLFLDGFFLAKPFGKIVRQLNSSKILSRKSISLFSSSDTSTKTSSSSENTQSLNHQAEQIEKTIREELSIPAKIFDILEKRTESPLLDSNKIKGTKSSVESKLKN